MELRAFFPPKVFSLFFKKFVFFYILVYILFYIDYAKFAKYLLKLLLCNLI